MEVTLLGCGQMGRAAGYALVTDRRTVGVTVLDRYRDRARDLAGWLDRVGGCRVRVAEDQSSAIAGRDAIAVALPWQGTRAAVQEAARAGVPVVGITRPPYAELSELDSVASAAGVPVLLPVGLEPGLTELIAADIAQRLVERTGGVRAVEIRCGGIPATPREPWGYTVFFGGESANHLPIAQRPSLAMAAGRVVTHPRFSGLEDRDIAGVGRLEAYHDGMVPWLAEHPALATATCTQKTLRWPGFAGAVTGLAGLGLLDEAPVSVDGVPVVPRRVVEHVLAPRLRARPDDEDIVVLEVTGHGAPGANGAAPATMSSLLVDRFDRNTGLSAVARTTGFTLACATAVLVEGAVSGTGWLRPHLALSGEPFARMTADLAALGVRWSTSDKGRPTRSESGSVALGGTTR